MLQRLKEKICKILAPQYVYIVTVFSQDEEDDSEFQEILGVYCSSQRAKDELFLFVTQFLKGDDWLDKDNFLKDIDNISLNEELVVEINEFSINITREEMIS